MIFVFFLVFFPLFGWPAVTRWPGSVRCRLGRTGNERGLWVRPTLATDRTDLDVAASPCRDN